MSEMFLTMGSHVFLLLICLRNSRSLQVPVLETPDGPIFESNAIARYGVYLIDIILSYFI